MTKLLFDHRRVNTEDTTIMYLTSLLVLLLSLGVLLLRWRYNRSWGGRHSLLRLTLVLPLVTLKLVALLLMLNSHLKLSSTLLQLPIQLVLPSVQLQALLFVCLLTRFILLLLSIHTYNCSCIWNWCHLYLSYIRIWFKHTHKTETTSLLWKRWCSCNCYSMGQSSRWWSCRRER